MKYDLRKYFKDNNIIAAHIALELDISKQSMNYRLNEGDIYISYLSAISEAAEVTPGELMDILSDKYEIL